MSDETEQNNQIALFMEISGADFDTAKQALALNNFNLELAISNYLERSNSIGSPEDDVAAASTSTDANLPIDDEDEIRPPILPRREQLILPNEDNFRYRKRRTVAARTVCPLRNFELEGRLQEERLKAAVMGNFTAATAAASSINDRTTELYASSTAAAQSINFLPTSATNSKIQKNVLGFSNDTNDSIHNKLTGAGGGGSISTNSSGIHHHHVTKPSGPSRLSELFRPPVDITFCGSFQAARDYAKEQNKWLIVNVQDMSDFNCQVLNRDIWSSEKLRAVIKKYFIFWQVAIDNTDGHRFQVFYGIQVFPYIGVIDPRTGEERLSYKTGFKLTHDEFMIKLKDYLNENTPHPNADAEDGAILELDEKYFEITTTKPTTTTTTTSVTNSTTNNHVTSSPCAKRKRVEPSSLSEQEQIELAIAHSLKEVSSAEDGNKSDSFEEPSSDESDFDFDDDTSNQSFVKSQTSQTVSEKSNTFENKIAANDASSAANAVTTSSTTTDACTDDTATAQVIVTADDEDDDDNGKECDSKFIDEPCVSTVETYDNYLGDENDEKARIQLRLPTSDRHIFEWPCTTKLKALKLYIPFKYPELTNDPYKVICPFVGGQSTNNILEMDDTLTLKEANLYPTAILHLRNED